MQARLRAKIISPEGTTIMDQTKVDDMLIKMIQPKLDEIENRFSKGEGLSGEDINTLLLKSQYNHINHLDLKLNEVTADVTSLKSDFKQLEVKVDSRFDLFESRMTGFEKTIESRMTSFEKTIESRISGLELKMSDAINKNMRWSIGLIALIVTVLKLADTFAK
jgi:uncharacterized coiled-coil DUF342 family protein